MAGTHDPHSFAHIEGDAEESRVLGEMLVALAEQIATALDCSECCIYEYLPIRNALRAQAIWALALDDADRGWIGQVHRLADIPDFEEVVTKREILVAYPESEDEAEAQKPRSMTYWGELAALWAPIVSGGEVLGLLELTENRYRRQFGDDDVKLVARMTGLAALALSNARQWRAAQARNRQLTAFIGSSRAMTSSLDLDEVLDVVCRQAAHALDTACSYIYQYDPDGNAIVWLAEYQRDPAHGFEEPLGTVYPLEDLPQDREVIEQRRPVQVVLGDPGLDPAVRQQLVDWEETASLMVPLIVGDTVLGALEVSETHDLRRFSEEEVALCKALGEHAAAAIRNAQLYGQLQDQKAVIERQAVSDGLTGLWNHRHFFERLKAEATRARRYRLPLAVLMLDLDDFKGVNDRFGHPAGDKVLRTVAEVMRTQLREDVDVPARYGGEEFAVILPHTGGSGGSEADADGALATAERVREAIATADVAVRDAQGPARITVSIGVATLLASQVDAERLVSEADKALYRAKRAGKNRVEIFRP